MCDCTERLSLDLEGTDWSFTLLRSNSVFTSSTKLFTGWWHYRITSMFSNWKGVKRKKRFHFFCVFVLSLFVLEFQHEQQAYEWKHPCVKTLLENTDFNSVSSSSSLLSYAEQLQRSRWLVEIEIQQLVPLLTLLIIFHKIANLKYHRSFLLHIFDTFFACVVLGSEWKYLESTEPDPCVNL